MLNLMVVALLWITVVLRVPSLRRGAKQRAVWLVVLTLAVARTIALPRVTDLLDQAFSRPGLITLLQHLLGVVGAAALLRFMALVTGRPGAGPLGKLHETSFGSAVAVVLTTFYLVNSDGVKLDIEALLQGAGLSVPTVIYWLVLELYLGAALAVATALFWRVGSRSTDRLLRRGLRTIAVGTALNAVYAVVKMGYIVAFAAEGGGLPLRPVVEGSNLLLTVANVLMVLGVGVPALAAVWKLIDAHRTMRALYPLWRLMQSEFPEIVLHYPRRTWGAAVNLGEVELRRYRRIIEIRDGMLELSNYAPSDSTAQAARYLEALDIPAAELSALVEACWIELGLRRMRSGVTTSPGHSHHAAGGASIEEEAEWLAQVSSAVGRSPHPREFAAWWQREHSEEVTRQG